MDVTLLADLKDGTRAAHRALESQLDLPDRIIARPHLAAVLAALLASWFPLEHQLATAHGWSQVGLDPHLGEATTLLQADLEMLDHVSPPTPAPSAVAPPFDTTARAAGGRYVLLGSAIGGRILARAIEQHLGPGVVAATRFFRRDGLDPQRDWRTFRAAVTSHRWSRREAEQAVQSARATFEFIAVTAPPLMINGSAAR